MADFIDWVFTDVLYRRRDSLSVEFGRNHVVVRFPDGQFVAACTDDHVYIHLWFDGMHFTAIYDDPGVYSKILDYARKVGK